MSADKISVWDCDCALVVVLHDGALLDRDLDQIQWELNVLLFDSS